MASESRRSDRILVVDDNAQNIALIRAQLERAGYNVTSTSSGQQALELIDKDLPDLILLDIMMPGLDGYAVCRELKVSEKTRPIPVVMLTSLHEREDRIRALDAGADDFLSKPADRAELLARVRSLLRQKSLFDALSQSRNDIAAQAELLAAEKSRAEAILFSMSDGVVTTDLAGRITFLNAAATTMAGTTFDTARGQPWSNVLGLRRADSPLRPDDLDPVAEVVKTERAIERELSITGSGGQELAVSLAAAPVRRTGGQIIGVVTVLRDVTRQRELERLRREVVALVSHELRTPLASIHGFAELLLGHEILGEQAHSFVGIIFREAQRLTEIINEFLDLESLEGGHITYRFQTVSLIDTVATVEKVLTPLLNRHRIEVELAADATAVHADRDRLEQVLMNIVSNAIKYSPDGGDIRIRSYLDGTDVVISVTDSGLGLPEEAIPRLFAKFYRVDRSAHRSVRGTGLGLAICKQVVEGWRGSIRAESPGLGLGSTFALTVPQAVVPAPVPPSPKAQSAPGRVLVVKGDPNLAFLIGEQLNAVGYEVDVVHDGDAAIARARAERPAAVVLDIQLVGAVDSWAVIEALRATSELADLPIITISNGANRARAQTVGIEDFFVKPVPAQRLIASIRRVVGPLVRGTVLVVDGDADTRQLIRSALNHGNFDVVQASDSDEALLRLREKPPRAIILGLASPHLTGLRVIEIIRAEKRWETIPILVVTNPNLSHGDRAELSRRLGHLINNHGSTQDFQQAIIRAIGPASYEGRLVNSGFP